MPSYIQEEFGIQLQMTEEKKKLTKNRREYVELGEGTGQNFAILAKERPATLAITFLQENEGW